MHARYTLRNHSISPVNGYALKPFEQCACMEHARSYKLCSCMMHDILLTTITVRADIKALAEEVVLSHGE